jgi:hypothetical protein
LTDPDGPRRLVIRSIAALYGSTAAATATPTTHSRASMKSAVRGVSPSGGQSAGQLVAGQRG